jgi:S1-C subfamily serine protease
MPGGATTVAPTAEQRPWYKRPVPLALSAAGLALACGVGLGVPLAFAGQQLYSMVESSSQSDQTTSEQTTAADGSDQQQGSGKEGTEGAGGSTDSTGQDPSAGGAVGGPVPIPDGGTVPGRTGEGSSSIQESATAASSDESTGVVVIETDIAYEGAAAAGTGLVLTSDGQVLTNDHVIDGATEISVTVPSTGETYTAKVVGADEEADVALLQLEDASDLETVALDEDDETVGQEVTAVGNAEGGGELMAADGSILTLEGSVTTTSENAAAGASGGETLNDVIVFSADVVSGDSGGAVLDDEGEVIGMTTAASAGNGDIVAYAIPIEDALDVVDQIRSGDESDGVTIGYGAFLGIAVAEDSSTSGGAGVLGVYEDTPAEELGLAPGDTITAVDDTTITSADDLTAVLETYDPGDTVTITWTTADGDEQSGSVELTEGPA